MKRTPLKRTRWRKRPADSELALLFARTVVRRDRACILDGSPGHRCQGRLQAAHVIAKGTLRKRGFSEAVVYDPRNGVCACEQAHTSSDLAIRRFPRELLPGDAIDFAHELGLSHLIERYYPPSAEDSQTTKETAQSAA